MITFIIITLFFTFKNIFKVCNNISFEQINHVYDIENKISTNQSEKTATIANVGDILLHDPIQKSCYDPSSKSYDFSDIFSYLKPYIDDFDYSVANLECSISTPYWGYSSYPLFKVPDSIIDATKNVGFDMLLTANNHLNDGGSRGILNTLSMLNQKNANFIGTRSQKDSPNYFITNINDIKFGMINYTYGQIFDDNLSSLNGNKLSGETSSLVNIFDYSKLNKFYSEMSDAIKNMKASGSDFIILYIHWGTEYQITPNLYQKEIAQKMCDLGVDVIVGGHPHVIQPIDILTSGEHKMVCIYSTGNIISNQRINLMNMKTGHTEDGVLFSVKFSKFNENDKRISDINVLPTWVRLSKSNGRNVYKIIPIDKEKNLTSLYNLGSDVGNVNSSYKRTMELLEPGINKFKKLLG